MVLGEIHGDTKQTWNCPGKTVMSGHPGQQGMQTVCKDNKRDSFCPEVHSNTVPVSLNFSNTWKAKIVNNEYCNCIKESVVKVLSPTKSFKQVHVSIRIREMNALNTLYGSWEDLVPTRLPPPRREHLHLLSVPCCHGYRVKRFCEAGPAERGLLFNTVQTCPERSHRSVDNGGRYDMYVFHNACGKRTQKYSAGFDYLFPPNCFLFPVAST